MKLSNETWIEIAHEMTLHEKPSKVVADYAEKFGMAKQTIYRNVKRYGGWQSGRAQRADAGALDQATDKYLCEVAGIYHRKSKANGKESNMPLERAIELWEETNHSEAPISLSRTHELLREQEIARKDAVKPTRKRQLKALYPNHVHQYDMSICRYYLNPDDKIVWIKGAEDYKNKPGRFDKKRRLQRHVIIDHLSGAFFVQYSFQITSMDDAEFLYNAWSPKPESDFIFRGVPSMLVTDNDKALRSTAMKRMYKYLGIGAPDGNPYCPWTKGVVEQFNRSWERWFESGFLFQKSADLDQINEWARDYAIRFQNTKIHTRTKQTRFAVWGRITEHQLREIMQYQEYQKLLHSNPSNRKVSDQGIFKFDKSEYQLKDLHRTEVDVVTHPYLYREDKTVTVTWPAENSNIKAPLRTIQVKPVEKDQYGYNVDAIPFGTYKGIAKSESEKRFDDVTNAIEDLKVRPFGKNAEKVKHIKHRNVQGTPIISVPQHSFTEKKFSGIAAKQEVIRIIKRPLSMIEAGIISEAGDMNLKELEELAQGFIDTHAQKEA